MNDSMEIHTLRGRLQIAALHASKQLVSMLDVVLSGSITNAVDAVIVIRSKVISHSRSLVGHQG